MTPTPNLPAVVPPRALSAPKTARPRPRFDPDRPQKAAIVLAAIGPSAAAPILSGVGKDRTRRFAKILSELKPAESSVVETVLNEFLLRLNDGESVAGGSEIARSFLAEVLTPAELEQAMADLGGKAPSVWRSFAALPDNEIREWLEGEHPQVAAVALAQLPADVSARVIETLEPEYGRDLVMRMGMSAQAAPALIGKIASALETSFLPGARLRASGADPAGLVASVMNHIQPGLRDEILNTLREAKPNLASTVERIMFTFENIPERVNPRDVGQIVRGVDEATLLQALKLEDDGSVAAAEFIFANLSTRLSERLRGDLAELEAPSKKASDAARAVVVTAITQARDLGEITLIDSE